jgi:hypothetical protein
LKEEAMTMNLARWMTLAAPVVTVACHDGILLGGGGPGLQGDAMATLDSSAPIPPLADGGEPLDSQVPMKDASPSLDATPVAHDAMPGDAAGGPNVWAFGNPVDGGNVFGVNANGGAVVLVSGTSSQDVGLLVTQNADTVFYVAEDSGEGGAYSYSLHAVPLQGGPSRTLASGLGPISAIVADAADLYFGTTFIYEGGVYGNVLRVPVSGGAPEGVSSAGVGVEGLALGEATINGQAETLVYWTQRDGATTGSAWWVYEFPLGVGYAMPFIQNQPLPSTLGVANPGVSGGDIYWLHRGTMQIDCTPTDGTLVKLHGGETATVTLLSNLQGVRSLAVAGGQAYVATAGYFCNAGGNGLGKIQRVDLASGTATTLASGLTGPDNLFVSGSSLYFTTLVDSFTGALGVSVLAR